jgi:hypothetical protein
MTEDNRETKRENRDGMFNLYYYISLTALCVVVVWHWIFGGKYGFFGTIAVYSVCVFIVLGFLNAIGIFGRR